MKRKLNAKTEGRFLPLLKVTLVVACAGALSILVMIWYRSVPQLAVLESESIWHLYLIRIPEILLAFLLIFLLSEGSWGRYGFVVRGKDLMLKESLLWGIGFALLTLIKTLLSPLSALTPINLTGSLLLEWGYIPIVEEIFFRGLIQTFLLERLEGEVVFHAWKIHKGTLWAAILYSGWHFINFVIFGGLFFTLILLVMVFLLGLVQGYIYQQSRSLVGPMLIHSLLNGLPITIGYISILL